MFKNRFILILIIVSVIFPFLSSLLNFYSDWLFFAETGFSSVFTTTLYAKTFAGLLFGGVLFIFVQVNLHFANRGQFPASGIYIVGGGNLRINRDVATRLAKPLSMLVTVVLSLLAGNWGAMQWEDLLLFTSSTDKKLVSLDEYVAHMKEDQKEIYYVSGETIEKCDVLPQTEWVKEKGYEILYLTENVDEFVLQVLRTYKEKTFKAINQGNLDIADEEEKEAISKKAEASKDLLALLKEALGTQVKEVRLSSGIREDCLCRRVVVGP